MSLKVALHNVIVILHNSKVIDAKTKHKLILELNSDFSLTNVEDLIDGGVGGGVLMKDELEQRKGW